MIDGKKNVFVVAQRWLTMAVLASAGTLALAGEKPFQLASASQAQAWLAAGHQAAEMPAAKLLDPRFAGAWSNAERVQLERALELVPDALDGLVSATGTPLLLIRSQAQGSVLAASHSNTIVLSGNGLAGLSDRALARVLRHEISYLSDQFNQLHQQPGQQPGQQQGVARLASQD